MSTLQPFPSQVNTGPYLWPTSVDDPNHSTLQYAYHSIGMSEWLEPDKAEFFTKFITPNTIAPAPGHQPTWPCYKYFNVNGVEAKLLRKL